MESARVEDLQTRGFVVVPSFLSDVQLDRLRHDFFDRPPQTGNDNYNLTIPSEDACAPVVDRVRDMLTLVKQRTDLRADLPAGAAYFATGKGINFAWHQDHESFFSLQNHYDYLNFYIPVVKPRRDKSNLSIVPFDVLQRECPKTFRRLVRGGAARFLTARYGSLCLQDDDGRVHFLRKNLDELGVTPELGPGDLLLLRGDMIHRTQDVDTERVALSIRACASNGVVRRERLADGGMHKARMMFRNAARYQHMFLAFDHARKNELTLDELTEAVKAVEPPAAKPYRAFMKYLLGQKQRSGTLLHFFPRVVATAAANKAFLFGARMAVR